MGTLLLRASGGNGFFSAAADVDDVYREGERERENGPNRERRILLGRVFFFIYFGFCQSTMLYLSRLNCQRESS